MLFYKDKWILTFPLYNDSSFDLIIKAGPHRPRGKFFDTEKPVVSTVECFDKLRVPPDHVSRSPSDTYYVNADYAAWCTIGWISCVFLILYGIRRYSVYYLGISWYIYTA